MSDEQVLREFTLSCPSLHIYETDKPPNLEDDFCVQEYRRRFGLSRRFWEPFMNHYNLGEYKP